MLADWAPWPTAALRASGRSGRRPRPAADRRPTASASAGGRRPRPKRSAAEAENEKLRRRIERLQKEVEKRDAALDVLGNGVKLLEPFSEGADCRTSWNPTSSIYSRS
ncbi:hypothetical protein GCM10017771_14870 [Streptomyces capitiformicae]|uniref:Transposase n=1 Tax=Streptomyces capitiformicae TaxID=2014920 RepID=A0A919GHC4_9ACTN|nr:hypothetical protein GCM10017771_14870 [Streptomyces capitiformicae]